MLASLKTTWPFFKSWIDNGLIWFFEEYPTQYHIYGTRGAMIWSCLVQKDGGADLIDFETNYKNNVPQSFADGPANAAIEEGGHIASLDNKIVKSASGTGTITAIEQNVIVDVRGYGSMIWQVLGTYSGVLFVQGSVDGGANWTSVTGISENSGNVTNNFGGYGLGLNGIVTVNCSGFTHMRLYANTFVSGTASVTWSTTVGDRLVRVFNTYGGALQASVVGAVIDNTPQNVPENFYTVARMTPRRALHVNQRDQFGNEVNGPLVLNTVTATAVGDTTVIAAPGVGNAIYLKRFTLTTTSGSNINPALREGTGGTIRKRWLTTSAFNFTESTNWKLPENTALVLNLAVAVSGGVSVNVEYLVGVV